MSKLRVAINGFGRIGRLVFRLMEQDDELEVVEETLDWYAEIGPEFLENNTYLQFLAQKSLKNTKNEPQVIPNEFIEYIFLFSPEYLQSQMKQDEKCC